MEPNSRIWLAEVREITDWTVTVHEKDLDLPADASDDAAQEAAGRLAEHMVTARHPDAIHCDTNTEAGISTKPDHARTQPEVPERAHMHSRTSYASRQIRAHDLKPGDVVMYKGRWRHVDDRFLAKHHDDALECFDLTKRQAALVRRYSAHDCTWVLVALQIENRRSSKVRQVIVPVRFYDLVTVQGPAGTVPAPA